MDNDNNEELFSHFLKEAVDTGCIWGLQGSDGWAQCLSEKYQETPVIPFWSQPELVQSHKSGEWNNYQITAISLEEFLDEWLTGMHADELLVGINWDEALEGGEYEPLDVLQEFEHLLR